MKYDLLGALPFLMACANIPQEALEIAEPTECAERGGLKAAFWIKRSELNMVATQADPLLFTALPNPLLSGFSFNAAIMFRELKFRKSGGNYLFEFTSDADTYANTITLPFVGKGSDNWTAFAAAVQGCDFALVVFDNNCVGRFIGHDWDGSIFDEPIEKHKVTTHSDRSGELGDSKAGDDLVLGGQTIFAPVYMNPTLTIADFKTGFVTP